jgi:hypothetical protein
MSLGQRLRQRAGPPSRKLGEGAERSRLWLFQQDCGSVSTAHHSCAVACRKIVGVHLPGSHDKNREMSRGSRVLRPVRRVGGAGCAPAAAELPAGQILGPGVLCE